MSDGDGDNVRPFKVRKSVQAMVVTMPLPAALPAGPFTLTIADAEGKLFEWSGLDARGVVAPGTPMMGTAGDGLPELVVNLLTGVLRQYVGRV